MRSLSRRGRRTSRLVLIQSFPYSFASRKNRGDWINALLRRDVLRFGSLRSLDAIAVATWQANQQAGSHPVLFLLFSLCEKIGVTGLTHSFVAAFCGVVRCALLMRSLSRRGRRTSGLVLIQSFSYCFRFAKKIGVTGFEPATSCSQNRRTTKLCYTPLAGKSRAGRIVLPLTGDSSGILWLSH